MPRQAKEWTVEEAGLNIRELIEAVRATGPQTIVDPIGPGVFLVSQINPEKKPSIVDFLVNGSIEE